MTTPTEHSRLLRELAEHVDFDPDDTSDPAHQLHARALAAAAEIEGRRGPTDEEIEQLAEPFQDDVGDGFGKAIFDEIAFARAILASFGGGGA